MTRKDAYIFLLERGMTALRLSLDENDREWYLQEFEFLHNVPSLIYETNLARHEYFWDTERRCYLEWRDAQAEERRETLESLYRDPLAELSRASSS